MILGWMIYTVLLAACVAVGAQAFELMARRLARPTRWIWAFALIASVGMSEVARSWPLGILTYVLPRAESAPWLTAPAAAFFQAYNPLDRWNPLLAAALWTSSALVGAFFAVSMARLVQRRRGWRAPVAGGHAVLGSGSDGPAGVGLGRGTILLPRWAPAAGAPLREVMLLHELRPPPARHSPLLPLALGVAPLQ